MKIKHYLEYIEYVGHVDLLNKGVDQRRSKIRENVVEQPVGPNQEPSAQMAEQMPRWPSPISLRDCSLCICLVSLCIRY